MASHTGKTCFVIQPLHKLTTSQSTVSLAVKILVTAIYNVYFHPLSKFPGPKSAAATPLPFIRRVINGHWVEWTTLLHEKYGEVVRIHPDELSVISASAWQEIYNTRPQLPKPKIGTIGVSECQSPWNLKISSRTQAIHLSGARDFSHHYQGLR